MQLVPALNDFASHHPEIELDVSFSDRMVNLVDEGFDMAVRVGRPADTSLIARKQCEVRIVLVGAADFLEEHGEPRAPAFNPKGIVPAGPELPTLLLAA